MCAALPYFCASHKGVHKYIVTSIKEDWWLGPEGWRPRHQANTLECMRHHSVRKWKCIMRFEIMSPLYLKKKVSKFQPHYILSLSTGLHAPVYSVCATLFMYIHVFEFQTLFRGWGWRGGGRKSLNRIFWQKIYPCRFSICVKYWLDSSERLRL